MNNVLSIAKTKTMRQRFKGLLLVIILSFYAALYVATSPSIPCDADCEKVGKVNMELTNRSYVYMVYRCGMTLTSDTLCVIVQDTTGINWNLLADTTCMIAKKYELNNQTVLIYNSGVFPVDTLATVKCP
jgi:hypothetical protein